MKMKKIVLMVLCLLTFFYVQQTAAAEVEIYVRGGTVNLTDGDINEGHKAQFVLGVTVGSDSKEKYQGLVSLERFTMTEPEDEDGEIPGAGLGLLFEGCRNFNFGKWRLYPYVSAGLHYWTREGSEKTIGKWHEFTFLEGKVGLGAEYKFLYVCGAIRRPLWIDTNQLDPGFGFESEVGVKIKKFRIGAFYDRYGFKDGGNFNVNFWGGKVSYIF